MADAEKPAPKTVTSYRGLAVFWAGIIALLGVGAAAANALSTEPITWMGPQGEEDPQVGGKG